MRLQGWLWRRGAPARLLGAFLALLALAGCGSIRRLDPPPVAVSESEPVLGIPNARLWLDSGGDALLREGRLMQERQVALLPPGRRGALPPANFLALSGGGDNGAFGAGLLVGWTQSGQRPSFDLVTGISAGALIAPFAFLGPDYDPQVREVFTEVAPRDLMLMRGRMRAVLFGEALADTSPLYRLIERHVNEELMAAIAREYGRGRLLLIGTTNLDLGRPVFWNIGAIAASGHPDALELFRRILLASASIPGAFPPVLIDVEHQGAHYQEMHVDGGASVQMFLWPPGLEVRNAGRPRERTAWVVRNGRMDAEWASTNRSILSIAGRSASTLLHFSAANDIVRIYLTAQRDGVRFRLAYIDSDFQAPRSEPFDTAFMRALFDHGYRQGLAGGRWRDTLRPVGTIEPAREAAAR
ncbi:patatin-like phospholipase family protein [Neoroseomonas soli]|uniref:Patatin family protein n=1 Tax=Neoroseomonas soli TaxID=1081025 RepID=A0A9X9WY41_9PROT|nr:patatin-like phospholipase family protein [Neoroseomonas soli]MBR0672070.1 patatin family protein [Neoroseomonas soli]